MIPVPETPPGTPPGAPPGPSAATPPDQSGADPFDPPAADLRGRATSGAAQTGLAQAVRLLVQVASVILLSRLLAPSEFGLLAMAGPVAGFAALFQDLGLTQAVVQKPRVTQAELSALFAVSLAVSAGLAVLLLAAAPVAAWFYDEPRVGPLTAAMGVNVVVGGLGALPCALLNRRMRFGALALIDAAAAMGGLAASVVLALLTHSVWALYAGGLVSGLIPVAGYWWLGGWRPSAPRRGSGVRAALRFGANVTGFNLANFFARNLDNVLIGRVWGERPLGLYDRAYKLLLLPLQQINNPLAKVMLPVLSQLAHDPGRYSHAFLRTIAQVLLITLPGIAFMVGTSETLVPLLLGGQWADAAPIFAVLGLASFLQVLNNPTGWLFMSQGRTRDFLWWGVGGATTAVAAFAIGLPYGPFGVACAYAASEYVRTPILWWLVTRTGPLRAADVARIVWPHYLAAAASLAAVRALRPMADGAPLLFLAFGLACAYAVSAAVLATLPAGRAALGESLRLARPPARGLWAALRPRPAAP